MLKIELTFHSDTALYFRTSSKGASYRWRLDWDFERRAFAERAIWVSTSSFTSSPDGHRITVSKDPAPNWTLPLRALEPYITDEDRAAFIAHSMRLARSGED